MLVNVTTKFNIGDTAYKFNPRTMKLEPFEIKRVCITVHEDVELAVSYISEELYDVSLESELFASKEEFVAQL